MNNKNITLFLLLLSILLTSKAYSFDGCNNIAADQSCVKIMVNSKSGQALAGMVVYLKPLGGQQLTPSTKEIVIGQLGKSFMPYVSVSQANSKVSFVNQDDITHHIYSAGSDNKFSFKIRAGQTNASILFNHESEVAMGCNIHDWMSGYLLVVNTPYFGKTDQQGQISFTVEKQEKYNIVVWHPQMQSEMNRMSKEVSISENSAFTFTLKNKMSELPLQENEDDFDFLSDYE